jgi:hypothetical protein
LFFGSAHS